MLDIFLYIKLYSESMPYSGIFSTAGIFRQSQAHDSGIIQKQFTHILNIIQADSGIEIWLIQAGIFSPIFRYIHKVTHNEAYLLTFGHISGNSGIFRILALPAQITLTNTYSSSQVILIAVQIYLKHSFIFDSKAFSSGQYFNDNNSNNNSMPPVQTHHPPHPRYTRQHATHVSTPPALARYSGKTSTRATHTIRASMPPTLAQISRHFSNSIYTNEHSEIFEQLSGKQLW